MKTLSKNLILFSLLTMGFAACSENEQLAEDSLSKVPVQLTTQLTAVDAGATRAGTSLNNTALTSGDVGVFLSGDYTAKYTYTAGANGALSSTSPAYYPASGNINIVAVYPASATDDASAAANFTVLADQREDAAYMSSDLMRGIISNVNKTSGVQTVALHHKMAKIIVNVTAGDGVGSISSVTLNNIKRQIAYTASTDVLGTAEQVEGTDVQVGQNNCAAVIPPQTIAASTNFLTIVTNAGTAVYQFAAAKELQAGNYYQLNITVNRTATLGTNTIAAWDGSGSANVAATTTAGELEIGTIEAQTYTGSALTPVPSTVKLGETTLTKDTDYELVYTNNVNAGTATVTAVGKGATYAGKVGMKEFTINKAAGYVTLSATSETKDVSSSGTFTVVTNHGGTLSVATQSGTALTSGPTLDGTTISYTAPSSVGSTVIRVTCAESANYLAATADFTLTTLYRLPSSATSSDLGKVICSNGHIHNAGSIDCGGSAVAMIAYVGSTGESTYTHGLAMALTEEGTKNWIDNSDDLSLTNVQDITAAQNDMTGISNTNTIINSSTNSAAYLAQNHSPSSPANCSQWFLPAIGQWLKVLGSSGVGGYTGSFVWQNRATSSRGVITNVNNKLTASGVGGTALTDGVHYWSSSESASELAVCLCLYSSVGVDMGGAFKSNNDYRVRAFLAF